MACHISDLQVPSLKAQRGQYPRLTPVVDLWPPYMHIHRHPCTHAYSHIHTHRSENLFQFLQRTFSIYQCLIETNMETP